MLACPDIPKSGWPYPPYLIICNTKPVIPTLSGKVLVLVTSAQLSHCSSVCCYFVFTFLKAIITALRNFENMVQSEREAAYGVDYVEHKELVKFTFEGCEHNPTPLVPNTTSPAPEQALFSRDSPASLKSTAPTRPLLQQSLQFTSCPGILHSPPVDILLMFTSSYGTDFLSLRWWPGPQVTLPVRRGIQ